MNKLEEITKRLLSHSDVDITIKHEETGIAWAGFWIGLGFIIAAAVIKGTVVIR